MDSCNYRSLILSWLTRFCTFLFVVLLILPNSSKGATAQEVDKLNSAIDSYYAAAFSYPSGSLRKFGGNDRLKFSIDCIVTSKAICVDLTTTILQATAALNAEQVMNANDAQMEFVIFDDHTSNKIEAGIAEAGFADIADQSCQLTYKLDGNTIRHARISVLADQPTRRVDACIRSQIFQALGLSLPGGAPFYVFWDLKPLGLSSFNEEQTATMFNSLAVLQYIHMCSDLRIGMTKVEAQKLFANSKQCLGGLKRKTND